MWNWAISSYQRTVATVQGLLGKRLFRVIKIEPEYFQKLIVSSCRAHFAVMRNVFYFIFAANK
jgi:hypothetical protein